MSTADEDGVDGEDFVGVEFVVFYEIFQWFVEFFGYEWELFVLKKFFG